MLGDKRSRHYLDDYKRHRTASPFAAADAANDALTTLSLVAPATEVPRPSPLVPATVATLSGGDVFAAGDARVSEAQV